MNIVPLERRIVALKLLLDLPQSTSKAKSSSGSSSGRCSPTAGAESITPETEGECFCTNRNA
jgi:hypothetical protein